MIVKNYQYERGHMKTEFKYYGKKVKAKKGLTLLWPPDFTHTHRGIPSPTEEKYIVTGWCEFEQ